QLAASQEPMNSALLIKNAELDRRNRSRAIRQSLWAGQYGALVCQHACAIGPTYAVDPHVMRDVFVTRIAQQPGEHAISKNDIRRQSPLADAYRRCGGGQPISALAFSQSAGGTAEFRNVNGNRGSQVIASRE